MKLFSGLAVILWVAVVFAGIIGWVMNIVKIFGLWNDPVTTELIIRIVGVPLAIIGAFAGWF